MELLGSLNQSPSIPWGWVHGCWSKGVFLLLWKERSMLFNEQLTLPYTYSLVPPDHLGFQHGSPRVPCFISIELLFIFQSPAWCHLLCEAFLGRSPAPLCSQPSVHLQYHFSRLSSQSAPSLAVQVPTVSLLRAGTLGILYRKSRAGENST